MQLVRRDVRGLLKNQREQARKILDLVICGQDNASDACVAMFCQKASAESRAARSPLKMRGKEI
jgi:hypothetical protein